MKPVWLVEVHRTVQLVITAATGHEAAERALDQAWEWQPEDADGGDQGSVSVSVTKVTDGDDGSPVTTVQEPHMPTDMPASKEGAL